jgi:histidine decarboxylase
MGKAKYLLTKLEEASPQSNPWMNNYSNTVVFNTPSQDIVERYQLAVYGNIAHIITMQHVTKEMIDKFISDLIY